MSIFHGMPHESVTLVKQDGRRFEDLPAIVDSKAIFTEDPKIPIEDGDEFIRTLPSGVQERFIVTDAGFMQGFGTAMPAHYQSKVRKSTAARPPATQQHFHLSGPNSRVNIGSHDASTNTVTHETTTLFKTVRQVIQQSPLDPEVMQHIIERLDAAKASAGQKDFAQRYSDFISAAANHATLMTSLVPYLPALSQLLT